MGNSSSNSARLSQLEPYAYGTTPTYGGSDNGSLQLHYVCYRQGNVTFAKALDNYQEEVVVMRRSVNPYGFTQIITTCKRQDILKPKGKGSLSAKQDIPGEIMKNLYAGIDRADGRDKKPQQPKNPPKRRNNSINYYGAASSADALLGSKSIFGSFAVSSLAGSSFSNSNMGTFC